MSSITSRMRITGTSGMDVQSMVSQMIRAESYKVDRAKQQLQILNWKQEIYRNTANDMRAFRDTFLSFSNQATNFRSTSMFKALKVSVTGQNGQEATGLTVTTGAATKPSTNTLKVERLASKDAYSSTESKLSAKYESSGKIDYEKLKSGDAINVTVDGVTKPISIDFTEAEKTNFDSLLDSEKDAVIKQKLQTKIDSYFGTSGGNTKLAVNVTDRKLSFEVANGHSFSVKEASGADFVTSVTGSAVKVSIDDEEVTLKSGTDTTSLGTVGFKIKIGGTEKIISAEGEKAKDLIENLNKKIAEEFGVDADQSPVKVSLDSNGKISFAMGVGNEDITISSLDSAATSLEELGFDTGSIELSRAANTIFGKIDGGSSTYKNQATVKDLLGTDFIDENFIDGKLDMKINDKDISITADMSIERMMAEINKSGAKMSYNSLNGTFALEAAGTGETAKIDMNDAAKAFITKGIGLKNKLEDVDGNIDYSKLNAEVEINGVSTTRFDNKIVMDDGVTISFDTSTKIGEEFTIKTNADTSVAVENIKKFVESYNKLLEGLNSQVNSARPQSDSYTYYEPLTDDQKDAMSDKEIEKWEDQAKKGLLRNDDTLGNIASKLRQWISEPVDLGNGTKISLRDIGIGSNNWYDYGKLSIDEDKLIKALEERPDDVAALFTKSSDVTRLDKANRTTRLRQEGLAERLDDMIEDAINSTKGSLVLKAGALNSSTVHENYMSRQIKQQNELIERLMKQLNNKEERYYSMFSAMEAAMSKSESQQSWLSSQM